MKIDQNLQLLIDLISLESTRHNSRNRGLRTAPRLRTTDFNVNNTRKAEWNDRQTSGEVFLKTFRSLLGATDTAWSGRDCLLTVIER